jgi:hypothetical protein
MGVDNRGIVRLLIFMLIMGATWWLVNRLEVAPRGIEVDATQVVVQTDDFEMTFRKVGPLSGSFMVFGGNNDQHRNLATHVVVAGLPMQQARAIHSSWPDFHRCASPGAAQAKRYIEDLSLIASTRAARDTLVDVVDLHAERIRSGGDRTCLTLAGERLMLESVRLRQNGDDLTQEVGRALGRSHFYLAEQVEIPDCVTLLR